MSTNVHNTKNTSDVVNYDVDYDVDNDVFYDALEVQSVPVSLFSSGRKFKDLYIQHTYNWLCEKFPDFYKVNLNDASCLLTGKPQAGKSGFSFGIALLHLLLERPVVFVVRNFTQDAEHMKAKLGRFALEHTKQMKKYSYSNRTISVVDAVKMSLVKTGDETVFCVEDFEEVKEALKGQSMKMVIALANGAQLKCINMVLDKLEECGEFNQDLVMLTDEADAVAYSEIKDPAPQRHKAAEYITLKNRCSNTYEISATVWDILSGNETLTNTNIVCIRPPPTYKGIRDGVQFIELAHKIGKWNEKISLYDEDPNLVQVYEDLMGTRVFSSKRYNCLIPHPVIVLHKTRTFVKHHKMFYELFRTDKVYSTIWTVLMECNTGLYLYSDTLKNKSIHIGRDKVTDTEGTGEFLFGKRVIIPQLFQWFIDNGGAKRFSHIVIKSGDFSGRSRSYVSTDGNWHLTHQYYGGSSSVPDMIQAQRILHDRPDSIPLIEYAPSKVIENIVKGDMMQDEQIERLTDLAYKIEVFTHVRVNEELWNKDKIPKAPLCCGNMNKSFKIQKTQKTISNDGGWNVDRYNDILKNTERLINLGLSETVEDTQKYIIVDQNKFKRGTKIYRLIEDVEKIIIDAKLYNKEITVTWMNEKLIETKYQVETNDKLHGSLWNIIQTSNKLKRSPEKPNNALVCWKLDGRLYVCLNM